MVLLGLLKYEEHEVEIENRGSSGEIVEDEQNEQKVELDLDLSANYNQSNNFRVTAYGRYFVE